LRVSYAKAKQRREARTGYVTLEGFWEDPPGYVDKVVWPNYVRDHETLFEDGDVEGRVKRSVCEEMGLRVIDEKEVDDDVEGRKEGNGVDRDLAQVLEWIVDVLMEELPKFGGKVE
jgi:nicotinamide/nicotinate riboside kinase